MQHFTQNAVFEPLFRYAGTLGVGREEICDAAEIDLAAATVGGGLVPAEAVIDAVEYAASATGYPNFGLLMAERLDSRIIGLPALIAERCGSIPDYYALMQQHMAGHTTGYVFTLDEDASGAVGRLRIASRGRYKPCHFAEASLAIHARAFRQFLGAGWRPGKILLAHRKLGTSGDYERAFGAEIIFEAGQNAITFSAEDLLWRASGRSAIVREQLEHVSASDRTDIASRTSAMILALLPKREATIERVAAALSMNTRTLQRRLAGSGSRYSDLLAETRITLAKDYLGRAGIGPTEVAARLGFSDTTALSRFLRQQIGTSPRALMRPRGLDK